METPLETIIEVFRQCDDNGIDFMKELYKELPDQSTSTEYIRCIMIAELSELRDAIYVYSANGKSHKNDWMTLHWIMSKWFQKSRLPGDVPSWYTKCAKIIPTKVEDSIGCVDVIDQLNALLC
jgi:hypothetical protein